MRSINVLLACELEEDAAPFRLDDLDIRFHRWTGSGDLPLLEGMVWVFVDWVLADISGLEVCRRVRSSPLTADAHVTVILEEDDQDARRRALRTGADDYMLAPVTRGAILDRILAASSRIAGPQPQRLLQSGDLAIDLAAFQARWQGKAVPLRPNEFRLLRYFVEHPGQVFSRAQLITALGKQETPLDERTVDVWIGRLRRALRAAGAGNPLRTVRWLGYVFDQP